MTPLERAKLRIEEDVARRRREQQDRAKARSASSTSAHYYDNATPSLFGADLASSNDYTPSSSD
jgi:hypothetical protein